ncbi:hypothetical protein MKW98_010473 [Papaver atlanticum]|uniref:E3 ubiquitin-protein ligase RNF123/RKP TPR repeat domain-containing protein n=1 Tax=Papaver atlanticum TaxID=357466 RepID=A0AAD4TC91_9MAGN|nr:hypothetical protein MKW98_010473 [Papaver atlanticum]
MDKEGFRKISNLRRRLKSKFCKIQLQILEDSVHSGFNVITSRPRMDEDAGEYTDDKDISSKVRKAAAKCLSVIIVYLPEMLSKLYGEAKSILKEGVNPGGSDINLQRLTELIVFIPNHIISAADTNFFDL